MWRPSGTRPMPARARSSGWPRSRAPRRRISPRGDAATRPMIACSVVDLPAPLGPIRPTISPRPSVRRRSRTAGSAAVAHLDAVELERPGVSPPCTSRRPGRRSRPRRCARISAGVPCASVTPRSSTWTRSQTSMISATLWSISRTPGAERRVMDRADDRREGGDLGLVQPRRGLVHEHEAGRERERARDAELALVAVREQAGAVLRARREPEQLEQLAAAPARVARRGAGARAPRPRRSRARSASPNSRPCWKVRASPARPRR